MAASRLQRWAIFQLNYRLKIKHVKGSKNGVADCLSRLCQENNVRGDASAYEGMKTKITLT